METMFCLYFTHISLYLPDAIRPLMSYSLGIMTKEAHLSRCLTAKPNATIDQSEYSLTVSSGALLFIPTKVLHTQNCRSVTGASKYYIF